MFNTLGVQQFGYVNVDEDSMERRTAANLFEKARQRSWKGRLRGIFTGQSRKMTPLEECREACALRESRYAGVQQVAIASIQGSEGRATEFDIEFNPVSERTEKRWVSVAVARLMGHPLPPVELLRFGDFYFVRDGHHRISVAKAFGETTIEAEVKEMEATEEHPTQA